MICETEQIVELCLQEAMAEEQERRRLHRKPFLRQAEIVVAASSSISYPAFCRDISRSGIGLLHEQPLEIGGEFALKIPLLGYHLELHCTTQWCSCLGECRYFSGSGFRCASTPQSLFLLSAVMGEKLNRRVHRRFPLFRPAELEDANGKKTAGFSRDVSRSGLGFVHRDPVAPGHTVVSLESSAGATIVSTVNIDRCVGIGHGWYSSAGRFSEELSTGY